MKENKLELKDYVFRGNQKTYLQDLADSIVQEFVKNYSQKPDCEKSQLDINCGCISNFCDKFEKYDSDFLADVSEECLYSGIEEWDLSYFSLKEINEMYIERYAKNFVSRNEKTLLFNEIATISNENHLNFTKEDIEYTQKEEGYPLEISQWIEKVVNNSNGVKEKDFIVRNDEIPGVMRILKKVCVCLQSSADSYGSVDIDKTIHSQVIDWLDFQVSNQSLLIGQNILICNNAKESFDKFVKNAKKTTFQDIVYNILEDYLLERLMENKEIIIFNLVIREFKNKNKKSSKKEDVEAFLEKNKGASLKKLLSIIKKEG